MARVYSNTELWAFVNRAETIDQLHVAADFITKLEYLDIDTYCEMMDALAYKEREYHRAVREREIRENTDKYGVYHWTSTHHGRGRRS